MYFLNVIVITDKPQKNIWTQGHLDKLFLSVLCE